MKFKHALFLNPYTESTSTGITSFFPPTGLEYVATSAKGHVDRLTLLDLRCEEELSDTNKFIDFIRKEKVDIICISVTWNRQFEEICQRMNMFPDNIPLVIGGYKATDSAEELFKTCRKIWIIVRGEGEETIKEILDDAPLENILGISYRKGDRIVHNANRPLPDVAAITAPDRSLRNCRYNMKLGGVKITSTTYDYVLSARGCPYSCKFCTFGLNPLGQKRTYAARSVDSVVEEIGNISADTLLFSDDNFFTDIKRAEKICDLLMERGIKKRFLAQARIEIADHPSLLSKITKAGFKLLLIGIESPHDHILAQMDKGFDSKAIKKAFSVLTKYPIYLHGYFIYGNIGETEEEMMCIPDFAKEIGVDSIGNNKLRIDKFSLLKKLAESTPGYHVTYRGELYSDMYSHAALKKIGKRIKFSFYTPLKLLKICRKLIIVKFFNFREIISFIVASPALLKFIIKREIEKKRLGESLRRMFGSNKA